jgi:son of sevenless
MPRVAVLIKMWIEGYIQDFCNDTGLQARITRFVKTAPRGRKDKARALLKEAVAALKLGLSQYSALGLSNPPALRKPATKEGRALDLIRDSNPEEFARALTLLEYHLFRSIQLKELMNQAWLSSHASTQAPHVLACNRWFKEVSL